MKSISPWAVVCCVATALTTISAYPGNTQATETQDLNVSESVSLYEEYDKDLIAQVSKSVVSVLVYDNQGTFSSLGSGVIYKEDSNYQYVITNEHVVDNGYSFVVTAYNYQRVNATLLGTDDYQDIGVLRIPKLADGVLATMGDSDTVYVGESVFAIGTPAEIRYKNSVTYGIVSGVNRNSSATSTSAHLEQQKHMIQMDMAINPGNSGGALFNEKGEVIGINNLKLTSDGGDTTYEGINLALNINDVLIGVNKIMATVTYDSKGAVLTKGTYVKSTLGDALFTDVLNISLAERISLGIPTEVYQGVYVYNIGKETTNPLYTQELGEQSIIVAVDGEAISNLVRLRQLIYRKSIGDTAQLTIYKKVNGVYMQQVYNAKIVASQY